MLRILSTTLRSRCRHNYLISARFCQTLSHIIQPLNANQTITEGPSWITTSAQHVTCSPRARSRLLRLDGRYREAHAVLRKAGILHTRNKHDLIELLLVLQHTDEFSGPHERLSTMLDALWNAPIRKPQKAFRILLNACVYEAAQVSTSGLVKLAAVERTAEVVWREMCHFGNASDSTIIGTMYRICGECRALDLAFRVRQEVDDPVIDPTSRKKSSEDATASFILCLGKCGRPLDAERLFFSPQSRALRASPRVLAALFQSYLAAGRISKAEALIAMHGASFLDLNSCNAFIRQCATLRLFDAAVAFLDRMERSKETGFPAPVARSYNLLLHGLSAIHAGGDDLVEYTSSDIIERMKNHYVEPNPVTYNTLIRFYVLRKQMTEAMNLFGSMDKPDRITFSHLMQGAAAIGDVGIATQVLNALKQSGERPTFGLCKSYLHVIAAVHGVDHAYREANNLVESFSNVLAFGDVGREEAVRMALIHACGKVGDLLAAFRCLGAQIGPGTNEGGPLAPLYVATVLMQACLDCGREGQALEVFESLKSVCLQQPNLQPNYEVYESLIKGLFIHVRDLADFEWRKINTATCDDSGEDDENDYNTGVEPIDERESNVKVRGEVEDGDELSGKANETRTAVASGEKMKAQNVFLETMKLVREMHDCGMARSTRKATYVYNLLIAASAAIGRFDLGLEVFRRMARRSNTKVLYKVLENSTANGTEGAIEMGSEIDVWPELEGCDELPPATVNTYNATMAAAWQCGRALDAIMIYSRMQVDRETEPNEATMRLLTGIALDTDDASIVQTVLLELDRARLPERLAKKRVLLRQKLLAMRWSTGN